MFLEEGGFFSYFSDKELEIERAFHRAPGISVITVSSTSSDELEIKAHGESYDIIFSYTKYCTTISKAS